MLGEARFVYAASRSVSAAKTAASVIPGGLDDPADVANAKTRLNVGIAYCPFMPRVAAHCLRAAETFSRAALVVFTQVARLFTQYEKCQLSIHCTRRAGSENELGDQGCGKSSKNAFACAFWIFRASRRAELV